MCKAFLNPKQGVLRLKYYISFFVFLISFISSRCVEQQMLHIGALSGTDMAQFISTDDCGSSLYRFYYGCTSVE